MNLSELMGHLRCNVLRDMAEPPLWTDAELIRYLNEAEVTFARRTFALTDSTSSFCNFSTVVGQADYPLDSRILLVAEAGIVLYNDDDPPVADSYHPLGDGARTQVPISFSQGKPYCQTAQVATHTIRLYPVPDDVYEVRLIVARKPLKSLVTSKDVPEIDDEYHISLCDFAAWRALNNNDPEGSNMAAAKEFRASWDLTIRDVRRDMARMRLGVKPQARANWTGKQRRRYY